MTWAQFHFTFRTLHFLESHADDTNGMLAFRSRPPQRVLVWHPEGIDWIFRTDRHHRPVPSRTLSPLLGQTSLLWAEGPRHTAYRRVLAPRLQGRQLQKFHHIIADTVHASIDTLAPGTVISLIEWAREITLRIISQILLGQTDDRLLESFHAAVERALGSRSRTLVNRYLLTRTLSLAMRNSLLHQRRELDKIALRAAKATAIRQPPGLAGLLLADGSPLGALDDEELRDQIMSLLFAGYETTASATAWTLYRLGSDHQLRHDVLAELAVTSHDGSDPTQVPLLHAVIQETLRLSPPAIIAGKRMLNTDSDLLGKPLTAGSIITPCIYLAHHQPDIFPNPSRFNPHRFLDSQIPRQHYFPFGGGTRRCLGSELAMLEIRMITTAMLRRCRLHCINPTAAIPQLNGPAMTLPPTCQLAISHTMEPPEDTVSITT